MSIAEQITTRIRGIVENQETISNEEVLKLATRYQEYGAQANVRLRQVSDLIRKNMVSEALRLAESEPPLLDLCAELDFVGAEKWREQCTFHGWPAPEPLLAGAINLLNDAYASGAALEPLLKEYRKAVREGATGRIVRILRRVAKLDAKNKTWVEDLRRFEHKRLEEIQIELQTAAQGDDKATLLRLLGELDELPPDNNEASHLRKAASARLKEIYVGEARARGSRLISELSAAYAAQDVAQAEEVLRQYKALLKEGYFQPESILQTQYDEALEWLQQEQRKRDEEKLYEDILATLSTEVEKGRATELDNLLNQLARLNRSIPELLENRARLLLEHHQLAKERRRRLHIAMAAGILLLLGAALTITIYQYQARKEIAGAEAELAQLFQAHDRSGYETYLASLEQNNAKVFKAQAIQAWVARKPELVRTEEQSQATCQRTLARLDAVRQGGFHEDPALIANLVAQAKTSAVKGEDVSHITLFISEWEAFQQQSRSGKDAELNGLLSKLAESLPAADAFASQNVEDLQKKLAAAQGQMALADKIAGMSQELALQLNQHKAKIAELAKGLEVRQELLTSMTASPSLYDYMETMRKYVKAFPADMLTKHFARWLENEPVYKEFSAIITLDLSNRVWNTTAGEVAQHDKRLQEKWTEVQSAITSLGEDKELIELYKYSYLDRDGGRHAVFFKGRPHETTAGVIGLGGIAYEPQVNDQQAVFKSQHFPKDKFEDRFVKVLPHCTYLLSLIDEARRTPAAASDLFLLNKLTDLRAKQEIPVLLRLHLVSFLMDRYLELIGSTEGSTWTLLAGKLKSIDQDLSWICENNQAVVTASQKATALLAECFSDSHQLGLYRAEWMLKRAAINRTVNWVGFAPFKAGNPAVLPTKRDATELWVVRPVTALDRVDIRVWEEQRGMERIHYEECLPGEPLFAPIASKDTRTLLQEVRTASGISDLNPAAWKTVPWPSNLRN